MSNYPMFYENSVPANIGDLESIADNFGITVTDVDIWDLAKCHEKPPHLGNVYLQLLFSRLESEINERYPKLDIDYSVDGFFSHFYIDGVEIYSEKQFDELINNLS